MAIIEQSSNIVYLSISDGKFVRRHKQPSAKTTERVNKVGKVVYEEFIKGVSGHITAISTKESDYGKFWVVRLEDGDETYSIEFNYSGGVATAFLKMLPNIDLSEQVEIIPNMKMDGDKKKTGLFINQNGKSVKWFWTKENRGDLPELEKKKIKGKEVWDDSAQMEYLENYVTKEIIPNLNGADQTEDF